MKTRVHGIIDNQASIQDFDSPTLLKTNSSSSVTQQPIQPCTCKILWLLICISFAHLPKPTLPPLPSIPSLPQPTLPTLPATQPPLPKPPPPPLPILPPMPAIPKVTLLGFRIKNN
ncbi:hypothetical protein POTOM_054724 [Populus tomentosa]|uniref:Uncharacterized protein n=1 Tax=Populus tomentosa TaxID=118781 RepID=A0A8X7XZX7_POPTO|nr:hypothetical protein POTOM_054724 [Populus tomentosa]